MPQVPIVMPQLGESIAEATILRFMVEPGADVHADQDLLEVETNKATLSVTSPATGRVLSWNAATGTSYPVDTQLGFLEVSEEEAARLGLVDPVGTTPSGTAGGDGSVAPPTVGEVRVEPRVRGLPVPAHGSGASYMSPRMKARMMELGLGAADLAGVAGSGAAGRVTIQDFEAFLESINTCKTSPASSMRVAVADAMRRSWTRPLATVGLPVRIDALLTHRRGLEPRPGPTLYALRALALALAENPAPAGRLVGQTLVHPSRIDLGFAVEVEDGVLVPVLRRVDGQTLAELLPEYQDLLDRARNRRLPVEATGGSVATVTNFGTFGLTWATPIPLPEQTLVLGMGSGRKAPFWDERTRGFIPVTEANFTLSFDHRVMDGGAAGRLLARVAELLAVPENL